MLPLVNTTTHKLERYRGLLEKKALDEILKLAKPLKGLKVFHVNSTPRGGGVAEILNSLVPLMKGVGLNAAWHTIPPRNSFFEITKKMHNALQGKDYNFSFAARKNYLAHLAKTAELMKDMKPDVWVIHDPQPAGVIMFLPDFNPAIARIHIDLSAPNREVWQFVSGFLEQYDRVIFSSKDFAPQERIFRGKTVIFPPAIDALSVKNKIMPRPKAKEILKSFGVNPDRPLIAQVSRFDPWKDPLGVIEAYKIAKKKIPSLQLALVGIFLAQDDPEAKKIFSQCEKAVKNDPDLFLFAQKELLGSLEVDEFVNIVQTAADVILQKSIKEGFGITVAEGMWKSKPVIGGRAGGIKLQIENGENGYLVSSPGQAASKIIYLLKNPDKGAALGDQGRKTVSRNFLMPRLLSDYLKLLKQVV
ncbi:MAG: glycosyltransferase [bacterium]|nr:glycosyltransferase [bacterium]